MRMRTVKCAVVAFFAAVAWLAVSRPLGAGSQSVATAEILAAAENYLTAYDRDTPALLAEETSQQTQNRFNTRQVQRQLRSNVLMLQGPGPVWIRDVIEVNGAKVVAQPNRLIDLVNTPASASPQLVLRIAAEGVGQQFGGGFRAVNQPGRALAYLREGRAAGLDFRLDGTKTIDGTKVSVLTLKDAPGGTAVPFAVGTVDGKFWIEPASGRVVQTELEFIMLAVYRTKITVRYAIDKALNIAVPSRMDDQYENQGELVTGRADYRNVRKVTVDPDMFIIRR
jgi:hypothetical protein